MTKLLYPELSYKIRGAAFKVYNNLGYGHKEKVYQKSLAKEFKNKDLTYKREKSLDVKYNGEKVGSYRPDFIINNKIIIEVKAVKFMPKEFTKQLIHYLKATGFNLGFLINFGASKLQIKRRIWTR